jgi:hypothetical protein
MHRLQFDLARGKRTNQRQRGDHSSPIPVVPCQSLAAPIRWEAI